jgi:hypothetical protein
MLAEVRMGAEETEEFRIGRLGHGQNARERGFRGGEMRESVIALHGEFFGARFAVGGWQGWPDGKIVDPHTTRAEAINLR